jgi:hypothetical protein
LQTSAVRYSRIVVLALLCGACRTHRYLEITTEPPGAEVRLDDQAIGRRRCAFPSSTTGRGA